MNHRVNPDHISIVLHRPKNSENIGAAARAARNMGIGSLIVVAPENYDLDRVRKMATHEAEDTVNLIQIKDDLKEALSSFTYVAATTARLGKQRMDILTPSQAAVKLAALSENNRTAVLFGPEDRGLTNEDLRFCHALINIPTSDFSSLNLAQAVAIICYEIFNAGTHLKKGFTPRLATRFELDNMYDNLKDVLLRISFINPENPDYWMKNLRLFFSRLELRAKEVSIIRGICRQIDWYGKKSFKNGLEQAEKKVNRDG
jgi:tRNA/rRNA methyltransferase